MQPSPQTIIALSATSSSRFGATNAVRPGGRSRSAPARRYRCSVRGGCGKTTDAAASSPVSRLPDEGVIEIAGQSMIGKRPYETQCRACCFSHYAPVFPPYERGRERRLWPEASSLAEGRDRRPALREMAGGSCGCRAFEERRPRQMSGRPAASAWAACPRAGDETSAGAARRARSLRARRQAARGVAPRA